MVTALKPYVKAERYDAVAARVEEMMRSEFNVAPEGLEPLDEAMVAIAHQASGVPFRPGMATSVERLCSREEEMAAFYVKMPDWQKVAFFGRVLVVPSATWVDIHKAAWAGVRMNLGGDPLLGDVPPSPGLMQQWCMTDALFVKMAERLLRQVQIHERESALAGSVTDAAALAQSQPAEERARTTSAIARMPAVKPSKIGSASKNQATPPVNF